MTYIEDPRDPGDGAGRTGHHDPHADRVQVRLHRIDDDAPLAELECKAYPAPLSTGRLRAATVQEEDPANPCSCRRPAGTVVSRIGSTAWRSTTMGAALMGNRRRQVVA